MKNKRHFKKDKQRISLSSEGDAKEEIDEQRMIEDQGVTKESHEKIRQLTYR